MKTCIKKIVSLTLGLALILSLCIPKPIMKEAQAKPIVKTEFNYVALGDSVSYGMSATKTKKSYTSLFYKYLKSTKEYQHKGSDFTNLSMPGDTSTHLLNKISDDVTVRGYIQNADFITINIGGNNLLGPVIAALCTAFEVDPENLAVAISTAMEENPLRTQALLLELSQSSELGAALQNGVDTFKADFLGTEGIISQIKTLHPNVEVYVNTIYNPFDKSDPFYDVFDYFIQQINFSIKAPSVVYNVVDVYGEFSNYEGNKTLVDFNLATVSLDPHPTDAGHKVIFEAHVKAYED